jgi:hypothetical protein
MEFQGREHSGIDVRKPSFRAGFIRILILSQDSRNIARILAELSVRGVPLKPNLDVNSTRRFSWMGPNGTIIRNF